MQEEPSDIEKLTQLKEYMANMPNELEAMKVKMNSCFDIYKMLEGFNYRFSKEDLNRRWNIFGSPREILTMVEARKSQLDKLKARFADLMKDD